jgi:hypothetical protein
LCYAIINQAIDDKDKDFVKSPLLQQINNAIDIDSNKLKSVKPVSIKRIDKLEQRLIIDGY